METDAGRRVGAPWRWPLIHRLWAHSRIPRPRIEFLWAAVAFVVLLYAAHAAFGLGGRGSAGLFDDWINDLLLWTAALACLAGAIRQARGRAAWLIVAVALVFWAVGDSIWSIRFGVGAHAPETSISDAFWLAWYPLIIAALVLLVRDRVAGFDLHRWIDGVAVMVMVATPWVALFLEPALNRAHASPLERVLSFVYPLGDALLFGAILGVFVVMAWRPGRMWLALGVAVMAMGLADALSSVNAAAQASEQGIYGAIWTGGAALVAFAAWEPHPGRLDARRLTGWPAIALPLAAQLLAAAIQLYAFFHEIPRSERILTVIVLLIAMLQIVLGRPRGEGKQGDRRVVWMRGKRGGDRGPPAVDG